MATLPWEIQMYAVPSHPIPWDDSLPGNDTAITPRLECIYNDQQEQLLRQSKISVYYTMAHDTLRFYRYRTNSCVYQGSHGRL